MAPPPLLTDQYLVVTGYDDSDEPWLLPPSAVSSQANPLQLPLLYIGPAISGGSTKSLVTNADFEIIAVNPQSGPVQVTVQVLDNNAWSTAQNARDTLRNNFLSCIEEIESKYELGAPPWLMTGATSIIAAAIVQMMPLPLSEVLLYACGLESGLKNSKPPAVDVMPGMRLRCEPSLRQYTAPPSQAFSGYVASGSLAWEVASGGVPGTPVQVFDAFLGAVSSPQITPPPQTTPPPATPAPLYSLIDLQLTNSGYKYHRLIYPRNVIAGCAVGSLCDKENVQLIGANTLTALHADPPYPYQRIFFGRDVVIPEICILLSINSTALAPCYVPLGTTVNNILERFTRWKPLSVGAKDLIRLFRLGYSPDTATLGSINGFLVSFENPDDPITDFGVLALPLCPGDALYLSFTNKA